MVSKEMKINSWLDSPVDEYEEDPYYIENKKDNYTVCESFINTIISVIEAEEKESITNKNQFRDDVIELIYNYSYEHKRK
jgi:hypothetical protein